MKKLTSILTLGLLAPVFAFASPTDSSSTDRKEFKMSQNKFPGGTVSTVVEVPEGYRSILMMVNFKKMAEDGIVPQKDTYLQSLQILNRMEYRLKEKGYNLKDTLQIRAYIKPDPDNNGQPDYRGWENAYREFFSSKKIVKRPIRTTVVVESLQTPDALIRLEIIVVSPKEQSAKKTTKKSIK